MVASVPASFSISYGAVGTVSYSLNLARGTLIPIAALQTTEDKNYVFTIEDGKAVARTVTIIAESGVQAAVSGIPRRCPGHRESAARASGGLSRPDREGGKAMSALREFETRIFNKINPVVNFSVSRYVLSIGFFVAIVVFGLVSTLSLGVDQFPSINIPVHSGEHGLCGRDAIGRGRADHQGHRERRLHDQRYYGHREFLPDGLEHGRHHVRPEYQQELGREPVSSQVSSSIGSLPSGVNSPTITAIDPSASAIVEIGITAKGVPLDEVTDYVDNDLEPILERVQGVAQLQIDGGPSRQFQILLNPNKLRAYNLSPQTVSSAVARSAINSSIGSISHKQNVLTFSTRNIPTNPAAISVILVDPTNGIAVRDVASVRVLPSVNSYARVNGQPMVLVGVKKTTDANTVAVVNNVEKVMAQTKLPTDYSYTVSYDATTPIKASVNNTYQELILTSIVVAIIVLLFLGKLNTAIAVILAIPIALSASPILLKLCGFNFNLVSLLALISAIGIVVDDSIVVAENVERYRLMGFSLKDSVLTGTSEVFSAVVAASLSLLAVLIPVSFISGFVGQYIAQFALGLAAAVAFSLFEALLFLTVRMAYTPDAKIYDWNDFARSFGKLPESMNWGFKSWRKGFFFLVGLIVAAALAIAPSLCLPACPAPLSCSARHRLLLRAHSAYLLPGPHDDTPRLDRGGHRLCPRRLCPLAQGRHQAERLGARRYLGLFFGNRFLPCAPPFVHLRAECG